MKSKPKNRREEFLFDLAYKIDGLKTGIREAKTVNADFEEASALNISDWLLSLKAVEDSIKLRMISGGRSYLDFLEGFINDGRYKLAQSDNSAYSQILEFLRIKVDVPENIKQKSDEEAIWSTWNDLEDDLSELDEYGGRDYDTEDYVSDLLYELSTKLKEFNTSKEFRYDILDCILEYIKSDNAGMSDALYEAAYSIVKNDEDSRHLAECFESIGCNTNAMGLYKEIKNEENYIRLRKDRLEYGLDYYDLVMFYWDKGSKKEAIDVLEKGLKYGKGRMTELKMFASEQAKENGNRDLYLKLEFDESSERLSHKSYQTIKSKCNVAEWKKYEPLILKRLDRAWPEQKLKIFLSRMDYDSIFKIVTKISYPEFYSTVTILKSKFPDEILNYYLRGIGNYNISATRKVYHKNALSAAQVKKCS